MRISVKKLSCIFAAFGLSVVSLVFVFLDSSFLDILNVYILICVGLSMWILVAAQEKVFTIYSAFAVFLALFHFGQVVLELLQLRINASVAYDVFEIYSDSLLYRSLSFAIAGFSLMNLFALPYLGRKHKNRLVEQQPADNDWEEKKAKIARFGAAMFLVLIIPVAIYDYNLVRIVAIYGHEGLYSHEGELALWAAANSYFPLALIFLLVGADTKKSGWKVIYYYSILRCVVLMVLTGKRGSFVIPLLLYVYCKHTFIKRYSMRSILTILTGLVVLVTLISYIALNRQGEQIGIVEFFIKNNVIVQILGEFGSTLTTTILAVDYVPSHDYLNGKSYLGAWSTMMPLSDVLFSGVKRYSSVSGLLNPYSPSGGALGGSFFAEMYINFGRKGLLMAPIFGMIAGRLSVYVEKSRRSAFWTCVVIYIWYGIWIYVRGNMIDVVFAIKRSLYVGILYYGYIVTMRRKND